VIDARITGSDLSAVHVHRPFSIQLIGRIVDFPKFGKSIVDFHILGGDFDSYDPPTENGRPKDQNIRPYAHRR
jgi:hypothetical protein